MDLALIYLKESVKIDSNYMRSPVLLEKLEHLNAKKANGDVKFSTQRFIEAIHVYTEVLDDITFENEFMMKLLRSRAKAYMNIQHFELAIDDYEKVLRIQPSHMDTMLQLAECHQNTNNYQTSIEYYENLLTIGTIQVDAQQMQAIQSKLATAIKRQRAQCIIVVGRADLSNGSYGSAREHFDKAILLWPENDLFHEYRAECLMQMHNYQDAFKDYRLLLMKTNVHLSNIDYGMIKCCLIVGDIFYAEKAIQYMSQFASTSKHRLTEYKKELIDLNTLEGLVLYYLRQNKPDSARESIEYE